MTLEAQRALRGCVGHHGADRPLARVVRAMAVAAGRDDPRFPPVAPGELEGLRIEAPVLGALEALAPVAPARISAGRDGVLVRRGDHAGLLLPPVATEYGWGGAALLSAACRKAGLGPDAWREPGTDGFTFQADVFRE